jgi:hypothetical protein
MIMQSDGAAKHFKNTGMLYFISELSSAFKIHIVWNFFVSYHGSNMCDSEAAHFKQEIESQRSMKNSIPKRVIDFHQYYANSEKRHLVILNELGSHDLF